MEEIGDTPYDFLTVVSDCFADCKTEEEIEKRCNWMKKKLEELKNQHVRYLKAGILNRD